MNYYIQYGKQGPAFKCSRTQYYNVKRAVLTASREVICLYEYKGNNKKQMVII